ncbi:MAG: hypothetical protein JXA07_06275 [Spirochaetes bacterium]|nr:hypothetical protein [Spirochaetota bacterium]
MKPRARRHILVPILLCTIIAFSPPLYSQRTRSSLSAGKQRNAEKGLKDNRYFFYFINTSITNLGTDDEKKAFEEAIQRDIIAQTLYMKFLFGESWEEIRKAQKILIDLYQKTLGRDIREAKRLLNSFAPGVVKSNLHLARHYLHLGYRDAEDARIDMMMADNFQERLYSMRLYRYSKAIKKVKHGKRYALFALLETKFSQEKKKEFGHSSYEELAELISRASAEDRREYHLLVHTDNYYKSKDEKSIFDRTWDNPRLYEIKEYEEYLKLQ